MTTTRDVLLNTLNTLLEPQHFDDYCPNGLQVEGQETVSKLVTGVTASQALIDAAIEKGADAVLVHHGYFWKNENPTITGMKQRRIKSLLAKDINLFAYHLPLDAHAEFGNNVQLANRLGLRITGEFGGIGLLGELAEPMSATQYAQHISAALKRDPLLITAGDHKIKKIAWCTGAAQSFFEKILALDVDAFITGEISEPTVHIARENGIHFFSAGHHATERYGVKALGEYVARLLDIEHQFLDIDNPV